MGIFFLYNQPVTLIIQIYSVINLRVSGIFSAHHQEFPTVHSALEGFMQFFMTAAKQSQDGCLEGVIKNLHET